MFPLLKDRQMNANPLESAAQMNNLDLFEDLIQSTSYTIPPHVGDYPAVQGNLKMVKYIYENLGEFFTTDAFTGAAFYGHLDIVKYLYNHTTMIVIRDAINASIIGKQPLVTDWLLKHRYLEPIHDTLDFDIESRSDQINFNAQFGVQMFEEDPGHNVKISARSHTQPLKIKN